MAGRSKSKTTTDRDQIRQWLEARRGRPAVVKSTRGKGDDTGFLRIDFPGYSGAGSLEEISWVKFFEKFDRKGHALGTGKQPRAGRGAILTRSSQPRDCDGTRRWQPQRSITRKPLARRQNRRAKIDRPQSG